ncbi:4-hydroxy-tetrahydrodipicolinate synthase [Paenibacillus xylaniclasticus]|uniref:4-hydroxy-tetrahydrodipicolinate synthase n=1 Tax=Paenibacillus xylaniclasticus TaxID=588083 RepID=UPI000FDA7B56|nr:MULTISPECIES: 4-hydroxy-tetrahydrodipicolinate synthase [Paenibacillus]GFN31837.1 4-hydroxy-tetrahydrodipicolinate synthase [Paenibacillus curdlanolyticus]
MDFGRLITAMVTPFDAEGAIDWETTGRLVDYLIDVQKSDSLVVSGTTGESPTLTETEKEQLFRFVVERAGGRARIIAGTGSNDTAHTIHLTKLAETTGVDGILLVTPYYNKPSQEGLYQHFKAVAQSTRLPVMLYNVPGRTGISMTAATTLRLAELPNVVATKDCASLEQLTEISSKAPAHFRVYSGDDSVTLPAIAVGAYGIVSVSSHIIGSKMKDMIDAYLNGDVRRAAQLHAECLPVFKGLFDYPSPAPVKYALALSGLPVGGLRLPLVALTDAEGEYLRQLV